MREISCRSRAMFEAAGELHDLHRSLCQTLDQIKVRGEGQPLTLIKRGHVRPRRLLVRPLTGMTQRKGGIA